MPRYIDAGEFRKRIDRYPPEIRDIAKKELRYTHTADVVEVVRCKDCVHKEREQPGMVFCPMMVGSWVDEDHFCGWGERSEDG